MASAVTQLALPGALVLVRAQEPGTLVSDRGGWQRAVLRAALPSAAKLVALTLASHVAEVPPAAPAGAAVSAPGLVTLVAETGYSRTHVQRQITRLRNQGWLATVARPAAGRTTRLALSIPEAAVRAGEVRLVEADVASSPAAPASAAPASAAPASAEAGSATAASAAPARRRRGGRRGRIGLRTASAVGRRPRAMASVAGDGSPGAASPAVNLAPSRGADRPDSAGSDDPDTAGSDDPDTARSDDPDTARSDQPEPGDARADGDPQPAPAVGTVDPATRGAVTDEPHVLTDETAGAADASTPEPERGAPTVPLPPPPPEPMTLAASQVITVLANAMRRPTSDYLAIYQKLRVILEEDSWEPVELALHLVHIITTGVLVGDGDEIDNLSWRLDRLPRASADCNCRACLENRGIRTGPTPGSTVPNQGRGRYTRTAKERGPAPGRPGWEAYGSRAARPESEAPPVSIPRPPLEAIEEAARAGRAHAQMASQSAADGAA
ncbi:hypothetical protein CcI6DRAFT_00584 [Frankia sp. CcI6]|uniref:hypothetical protein n=1 Tax=Frankia TaxID=1854 RepID=UPI0002ED1F78|nr:MULTISPECIES: hypothetical protein [Frankia]ETA04060.1 hypothetical protein CcI6DRAFT_00584 [Frankia sp. CcI6]OAA30807.1 hypothetical protein AAY23_100558 [Frankia casuarinae]OHV57472.1 hypothetical protein CgIS1_01980 [Frankia sp. CgIS1]